VKIKNALFCLFFVFSATTFARSPAVEPVTGISIDQYKQVDPSNDPGFDWNQQNSKAVSTSLITTRVPSQNSLIQKTRSQEKSLGTTLLLIALLTLPFFIWNVAMRGLDKTTAAHGVTAETVDLSSEREKRSHQETQEINKKAS
jgi:hypothetical protein